MNPSNPWLTKETQEIRNEIKNESKHKKICKIREKENMKKIFIIGAALSIMALVKSLSAEGVLVCPHCENTIIIETKRLPLRSGDAEWTCKVCRLHNWAEYPPYVCRCGTPMGEE